MKIQYCSDLHLEFDLNNKFLKSNLLKKCADILILAGDIAPLQENYFRDDFFKTISNQYEKVFWLPGNHEFYHNDLASFGHSFKMELDKNIEILYNIDFFLEGIHFIFCPLWSNISDKYARIIEQNVADFHYILQNDRKIKISDFNYLHQQSLKFLENSLIKPSSKRVVVSHHVPSFDCNSTKHKNSIINEAFCVDISNIIEKFQPNFWIYGHSHYNQKPLFIGKTALLTNQLGYVENNEHLDFKLNAYFSI